MQKFYLRLASFLILCGYLFSFSPYKVTFAQAEQDIPGVDLFVLLEQSQRVQRSDPDQLRIDTAKYLVDYMAFYAAAHPEQEQRISIIGVSRADQTRLIVPLTSVPATLIDENTTITKIKNAIVATEDVNNNILSAMKLIEQELNNKGNLGKNRQKVIIFITTGLPLDNSSGSDIGIGRHFGDAVNFYNNMQSEFAGKWDLVTIGINKDNKEWDTVKDYWKNLATHTVRLDRGEEVRKIVVEELSRTLADRSVPIGKNEAFEVEPYLSYMRLSIFKSTNATVVINFEDEQGKLQTVTENSDDVTVRKVTEGKNGEYEFWLIKNPTAATWQVGTKGDGDIDVVKQAWYKEIKLVSPTIKVPSGLPFYFRMTLTDLKQENTKYPLAWDAILITPNKNKQKVELIYREKDGLVHSVVPFTFAPAQTYILQVNVSTMFGKTGKTDSIATKEFKLESYQPVLKLDPAPVYLQYKPVDNWKVGLVDPLGDPIPIDPDVKIDATIGLKPAEGNPIKLAFDEKEPGVYSLDGPIVFANQLNWIMELQLDGAAKQVYQEKVEVFRDVRMRTPQEKIPLNAKFNKLAIQLFDAQGFVWNPPSNGEFKLKATIDNINSQSLTYNEETESFEANFENIPTGTLRDIRVVIDAFVSVDGVDQQLFQEVKTINVTNNLYYYEIKIPSPDHRNDYPLHDPFFAKNMQIVVDWFKDGQPMQEQVDGETFIRVDIKRAGKDGEVIVQNLKLEQKDGSRFSIEIANEQLNMPGDYEAVFYFDPSSLGSDSQYISTDPVVVLFSRSESIVWKGLHFTGYAALFLCCAAILTWLIYQLYNRFPPYPKGELSILAEFPARSMGNRNRSQNKDAIFLLDKKRKNINWRSKVQEVQALQISHFVIRRTKNLINSQAEGITVEIHYKNKPRVIQTFNSGKKEKQYLGQSPQQSLYLEYTPPSDASYRATKGLR